MATQYLYRPIYGGLDWMFTEAPWDLAHIRTDLPKCNTPHGMIATRRKLTTEELSAFELKYEGEA